MKKYLILGLGSLVCAAIYAGKDDAQEGYVLPTPYGIFHEEKMRRDEKGIFSFVTNTIKSQKIENQNVKNEKIENESRQKKESLEEAIHSLPAYKINPLFEKRVSQILKQFTNNPYYLGQILRGSSYISTIKKAATEKNIPWNILYCMAFTESKFNKDAGGKIIGGLLQFDQITGKFFGLHIGYDKEKKKNIDERFIPERSIEAAANALAFYSHSFHIELDAPFENTIYDAIAAFKAGKGAASASLYSQHKKDYRALRLGNTDYGWYVPKVEACIRGKFWKRI